MGRGLLVFALLITGALTILLGRSPASAHRSAELGPIVISLAQAEHSIISDTLRRDEVLAQVFARQGLDPAQSAAVVQTLREHVNPRTLRAGVTVDVERTVTDRLLAITIRVDADRELRLLPEGDGWVSEVNELSVAVDTLVLAGSIETTLYHSVMELPLPSLGAQERIELVMWGIYRPFQWAIDFGLEIRSGDSYRGVYERHVREDGTVRMGRMLAAEFTNRGTTHRAYWLDSRGEYFDDDGKSMKRMFLKAPVDFRRISSRFARRRYHPSLGVYRAHLGTDYAAARGTQVFAAADGTVTRASWWGGYGRVIEIRHANGYRTRYAHLNGFARGVRTGSKVRQGQLIGFVGASGLATGSHLHYEMWRNGSAVDPRTINLPSGEPVRSDEMSEFRRTRNALQSLLGRVEDPGLLLTE